MLGRFVELTVNHFHSANLQSRVKKGKMSEDKFEKTMSLLQGALDYSSFKDVDMVIEVMCAFLCFLWSCDFFFLLDSVRYL